MGHRKLCCILLLIGFSYGSSAAVELELAVGGWQQSINGTLGYQALTDSDIIDLDEELSFDDEARLTGRIKLELPLFFPNFYIVAAPSQFEGTGDKSVAFNYGDVTFNANAQLNSKITMDQYDIGLYFGLPFIKTGTVGKLNADIGLNLRIIDLETSITGMSGAITVTERQSITVPVPMLYLGIQFMPTDQFSIEAEGRGVSIGDNQLFSLLGRARYQWKGPLFVSCGYRYDKVDVDEDDVVADVDFSGPFVEVGLSF